jgi:Ni/Co efflux regulator RcnB
LKTNSIRTVFRAISVMLAMSIVAGTVLSTAAQAQYRRRGLSNEGYRVARERGYSVGLDRGRDDADNHRSYDYNHSEHYRDGDSGYHSEYGSREAYRVAYREAFRNGYSTGYRQRSRGRWRR